MMPACKVGRDTHVRDALFGLGRYNHIARMIPRLFERWFRVSEKERINCETALLTIADLFIIGSLVTLTLQVPPLRQPLS
jgi:hypothetical protein